MRLHIITSLHARRPELMAILGLRGYRITAPRKMIAGLMERKHEGFTAQDLCDGLPSVGRATVFRTLKLFLEVGVICKLDGIDSAPIYSLCQSGHHHHTVCIICGSVEDLRLGTVERMLGTLCEDFPEQVVGHSFELYVDCKNRKNCPRNGKN